VLPRFGYLKVTSLEQAVRALDDYAGGGSACEGGAGGGRGAEARVLAGGTDLLIGMKDGTAAPRHLIDIKHIPELRRIQADRDGGLTIGACVTVNEILEFAALPEGMAALRQAASSLGTNQVRNRATVGGNLCNASPACDLGPALLVLGAQVRAVSASGDRLIPLRDLFTCPKQTCLAANELLTEIAMPPARGTVSGFAKRTRIRGHDLSVVNAAAAWRQGGAAGRRTGDGGDEGAGLKIALGAVAPRPLLMEAFGGADPASPAGQAAVIKAVMAAIAPIDDVRGSGEYRREMVAFLVGGLLVTLTEAGGAHEKGGRP